jgi:hypothetical protein
MSTLNKTLHFFCVSESKFEYLSTFKNITHTKAVHKIQLISKGIKTRCGHNKFLSMVIAIPMFLFVNAA